MDEVRFLKIHSVSMEKAVRLYPQKFNSAIHPPSPFLHRREEPAVNHPGAGVITVSGVYTQVITSKYGRPTAALSRRDFFAVLVFYPEKYSIRDACESAI